MVGIIMMLVVIVVFVLMVVVIKSRKRLVLKWYRKPNSAPRQIIIFDPNCFQLKGRLRSRRIVYWCSPPHPIYSCVSCHRVT